jgi:hypothetical protein
MRQVGGRIKPTTIISVDGDTVKLETKSTFKNSEITFKIGEEFEENTADDRKSAVSAQRFIANFLLVSSLRPTNGVTVVSVLLCVGYVCVYVMH